MVDLFHQLREMDSICLRPIIIGMVGVCGGYKEMCLFTMFTSLYILWPEEQVRNVMPFTSIPMMTTGWINKFRNCHQD